VSVLSSPFGDNDRARAERRTEGLIKVVAGRRGRILGATIVGQGAGELILPWGLAISSRLTLKAMVDTVIAYPTLGEISARRHRALFRPGGKSLGPPPDRRGKVVRLGGQEMTEKADANVMPTGIARLLPLPELGPARSGAGSAGKLLLLTVLIVMVGEVLIFVPSIANFRLTWLQNRIATAEIAALPSKPPRAGRSPTSCAAKSSRAPA
jgi:hypothetical protein